MPYHVNKFDIDHACLKQEKITKITFFSPCKNNDGKEEEKRTRKAVAKPFVLRANAINFRFSIDFNANRR